LKTEFTGQLPQEFSKQENATSIIQPNFNYMNKEEPSRYVSSQIYFINVFIEKLLITFKKILVRYRKVPLFTRFRFW
jgi:hypothetical protein